MNDLFVTLDNRLPVLADEIRAEHQKVLAAGAAGTTAARAAGAALIEAKEKLPHGQWLPWLRETGLKPRTAQGYMQLAKLEEGNAQRIAHLGIGRALRAIADRVEQPLPAAGEIVRGHSGPQLEELENLWHELETFIWPSSKYPGFFWLLCYLGSTELTVRKPTSDPYGHLEYAGFPVDTATWRVDRDEGWSGALQSIRQSAFRGDPGAQWVMYDG
jgi:DUF3102 family protein